MGRTGRYRIFPIVGSVLMTVGLFLLSTMDAAHRLRSRSRLYMLVLGVGIGLCMQMLMIIVQNTGDYRDLGVATSGVTFFRDPGQLVRRGGVRRDLLRASSRDALPAAIAALPGSRPAATPRPRPRCTASPPT